MANKCKICSKSVYPMDPQINLDGSIFHKVCAKCADCACQITLSNFTKHENQDKSVLLLCKTHYFKRFREQNSYVGGDKFQVKSPRDLKVQSTATASGAASAVTSAADPESASESSSAGAAEVAPSAVPAPAPAPVPAPATSAPEEPVKPVADVRSGQKEEIVVPANDTIWAGVKLRRTSIKVASPGDV